MSDFDDGWDIWDQMNLAHDTACPRDGYCINTHSDFSDDVERFRRWVAVQIWADWDKEVWNALSES